MNSSFKGRVAPLSDTGNRLSLEIESRKQRKSVFSQNKHNTRVRQSKVISSDGPANLQINNKPGGETIGSAYSFNETPQPGQVAPQADQLFTVKVQNSAERPVPVVPDVNHMTVQDVIRP